MNDEQRRVALFQPQSSLLNGRGPEPFSRPAALSITYVDSLHGASSAWQDEKIASGSDHSNSDSRP